MSKIPCPDCKTGRLSESSVLDEINQNEYLCDGCGSYFNFRFVQGWYLAHEKFWNELKVTCEVIPLFVSIGGDVK